MPRKRIGPEARVGSVKKELAEELAADPVAFLRSLVTSPIPVDELDWRDFKADPRQRCRAKVPVVEGDVRLR
jgi:hypothetical protein